MKISILLLINISLILSCQPGGISAPIKTEAVNIATQFASSKMDSFTVVTDDLGVVALSDNRTRYLIYPDNIFQDEIDEKAGKDILVTVDSLHDPYVMPAWHIILSKERKELKIASVLRSDMRVLMVKNGIIIAEIPTHTPESPLYYCSECRDTLEYVLQGGNLVLKIE